MVTTYQAAPELKTKLHEGPPDLSGICRSGQEPIRSKYDGKGPEDAQNAKYSPGNLKGPMLHTYTMSSSTQSLRSKDLNRGRREKQREYWASDGSDDSSFIRKGQQLRKLTTSRVQIEAISPLRNIIVVYLFYIELQNLGPER
ncbi:hypothetical protein TSMEX_011022 [Taenia solium]|eukprot:TsM_000610000 transcript=TsM_000610000 gene=TsM_000610000